MGLFSGLISVVRRFPDDATLRPLVDGIVLLDILAERTSLLFRDYGGAYIMLVDGTYMTVLSEDLTDSFERVPLGKIVCYAKFKNIKTIQGILLLTDKDCKGIEYVNLIASIRDIKNNKKLVSAIKNELYAEFKENIYITKNMALTYAYK